MTGILIAPLGAFGSGELKKHQFSLIFLLSFRPKSSMAVSMATGQQIEKIFMDYLFWGNYTKIGDYACPSMFCVYRECLLKSDEFIVTASLFVQGR